MCNECIQCKYIGTDVDKTGMSQKCDERIHLYFYLQYFWISSYSCSAISEVTSQSHSFTIFSVPVNFRHEKYIQSERTRNMQNIDITPSVTSSFIKHTFLVSV